MAAKPENKEAKEAAAPAAAPAEAKEPKGGGLKAFLPAILAVALAPAASFAVAEFVLVPRLQAKLKQPASPATDIAAPEAEHAEEPSAKDDGHGGGKEAKGDGNYEFTNVVVNLAGTMGTRYLKTSFVVSGVKGKSVKGVFDGQKARLTDITLNVLSSLTLADLEEPGSKNVLREKLVNAYNQALGKRVVEQVYFSDFVIQ